MSGYRYFMRNVRLSFLLIFFLVFGLAYQGYADCPLLIKINTELESTSKKFLEGLLSTISFGSVGSFSVKKKLYTEI